VDGHRPLSTLINFPQEINRSQEGKEQNRSINREKERIPVVAIPFYETPYKMNGPYVAACGYLFLS
jgi:hypothetical protein